MLSPANLLLTFPPPHLPSILPLTPFQSRPASGIRQNQAKRRKLKLPIRLPSISSFLLNLFLISFQYLYPPKEQSIIKYDDQSLPFLDTQHQTEGEECQNYTLQYQSLRHTRDTAEYRKMRTGKIYMNESHASELLLAPSCTQAWFVPLQFLPLLISYLKMRNKGGKRLIFLSLNVKLQQRLR